MIVDRLAEWNGEFGDILAIPEKYRMAEQRVETYHSAWYFRINFEYGDVNHF